ncbi:MAG: hypothetical protein DDT26_00765 [Dehalococcoidia bacterium]|nr:hypothetical protein [Chloroflexota bacterium]
MEHVRELMASIVTKNLAEDNGKHHTERGYQIRILQKVSQVSQESSSRQSQQGFSAMTNVSRGVSQVSRVSQENQQSDQNLTNPEYDMTKPIVRVESQMQQGFEAKPDYPEYISSRSDSDRNLTNSQSHNLICNPSALEPRTDSDTDTDREGDLIESVAPVEASPEDAALIAELEMMLGDLSHEN